MRIIYADILITINLAVDYFVLFGTARLAGAQFLRMRALFASAIGALYSLCVIFPLEQWALSLSRLAVSAAMDMFRKKKGRGIFSAFSNILSLRLCLFRLYASAWNFGAAERVSA